MTALDRHLRELSAARGEAEFHRDRTVYLERRVEELEALADRLTEERDAVADKVVKARRLAQRASVGGTFYADDATVWRLLELLNEDSS